MIRLEVKKKLSSLEAWKFGGITRQLLQNFVGLDNYDMYRRNFTCSDFINLLSCQTAKLPNFRKSLTAFTMADRLSRVAERHPHFRLLTCGQDYTLGCRLAFTMADRRSSRFHILSCALAFTMAEILISLTIIGIIAAITLPALQANINESAWKAQRKALYSRMSQAISMMPSLNGYGTYAGSWSADVVSVEKDTAAQAFVTDGLSKVLNITNICSIPANTQSATARAELKKCGIPSQITTMVDKDTNSTSKINFPTKLSELNNAFINNNNPQKKIDTNVAAFEMKNGESVAVFYNPNCLDFENTHIGETRYWQIQPIMCADFIYDLNGTKGPNKMGKDIGFITAMYPTNSEIVAPIPLEKNYRNSSGNYGDNNYSSASANCKKQDKDGRVPNKEETMAMFYNRKLLGIADNVPQFITSSLYNETDSWKLTFSVGRLYHDNKSNNGFLRCIKR